VQWGAGVILLILAGVVLLPQVSVSAAGTPPRACGSAWDVVTGRAGWPRWWAADLSDPAAARGAPLIRTLQCPGALNGRIAASAGLGVGAVAVVAAGEAVALRRARRVRPVPARPGPVRRLRLFGTAVTVFGGLLTAGGLAGIAILVADPGSPLFLYVSRPLAAFAGLLLLLPAILLIALGQGIRLIADCLAHAEHHRETS
jgi:hypothetical protein